VSAPIDKSTWKKVKFGDVVRNVNETVSASATTLDRAIAMEHLEPGCLEVKSWGEAAETTFTRRVKPGQTLFGKRRAYQRKVAYASFDAVCSGDILTLETVDPTKLLGELLPFLCMTEPYFEHAVGTSAGSLSPRTRWSDLASYEFLLPPIDEQKRIADLLWSIEAHREVLAERAATATAAYKSMMVSALQRSGPTVALGDLTPVRYGKGLPREGRTPGAVPVYGSAGSEDTHTEALSASPCIVIGRKGTAGAVHWSGSACFPIDTAFYLDAFDGRVRPRVVYECLLLAGLPSRAETTAVPSLRREALEAVRLPLLDLDAQEIIERIGIERDDALLSLAAEQASVSQLRVSILAHLLNEGGA
jgi:hypothetical protein